MSQAPLGNLAPIPLRADEEEKPDPELLELPDPPKRERTATIAFLLFTAVASLAMVAALRLDAGYAFANVAATEVGDLATAPTSAFVSNAFVEGQAMLGAAHAIRYERPLLSDTFRLMPVVGRSDVWVEVRVPAGEETVRYVPPPRVKGRLVAFDAAGLRHRGLASAVRESAGQTIPRGSWLLVDGEAPSGSRWALLLVAMFAGFAVWNVLAAARLLRKVR